jgi:hypothetical protein
MHVTSSFPSFISNVCPSAPILVSSSMNNESENDNPTQLAHSPLVEPVEHEPTSTPQLPRWVYTIQEVVGDFASDPFGKRHTCSRLQQSSFLLSQVSDIHSPKKFA